MLFAILVLVFPRLWRTHDRIRGMRTAQPVHSSPPLSKRPSPGITNLLFSPSRPQPRRFLPREGPWGLGSGRVPRLLGLVGYLVGCWVWLLLPTFTVSNSESAHFCTYLPLTLESPPLFPPCSRPTSLPPFRFGSICFHFFSSQLSTLFFIAEDSGKEERNIHSPTPSHVQDHDPSAKSGEAVYYIHSVGRR